MRGVSLAARYSKELRRRFGLWPTWLPDSPVAVGDFGRVQKGVFVREGGAGDLGVALETTEAQSYSDQLFASHGVRHLLLGGGASEAATGTARARIEFDRGFGVFVGLRGCHDVRAADTVSLAHQLANLRGDGRWEEGRCVITGVVQAQSALIAIDAKGGGSLELAAASPAPDLLTLLSGEVRIASEASIGYRSLVSAGCTPLARLSRLAGGGDLVMRGKAAPSPRLVTLDPQAGLTIVGRSEQTNQKMG